MTVSLRLIARIFWVAAVFPALVYAQVLVSPEVDGSAAGEKMPAIPPPPTWLGWGSVSMGVGIRDNLLLSHAGEEQRGFLRGGVDATAWHVPQNRIDYLAVLSATGTRYFASSSVDHEEQVITLGTWRYRSGEAFRFSIDGSASYSHLIYDVSDTDVQQVVTEVKRSAAGIGPALRWGFLPGWWVETQGAARRETYPDGFNNRGIIESAIRMGWHPGKRLSVSVAGLEWKRRYDSREQYSVGGRELAGTSLAIRERAGEVRIQATLDAAGHWKSDTRATVSRFADNGSGYLNYRERKLTHEVEWMSGNWLCSLEGSARRVEFELQTIGFGVSPPPRVRDAFLGRGRLERKLNERWTVFGEYTWERNRCNDPVASYVVNEGLLGIRWNWEK